MWEPVRCVHAMRTDLLQFEPLNVTTYNLLLLLLLLLLTAFELTLGGSSPYTSTNKTNKNKYTKRNNTKHSKYKYTYYQDTHTYTHNLYYWHFEKGSSLFFKEGEMHLFYHLLHTKQKNVEGSVLLTTISCVRPFSKHAPRLHITTAPTLNPSYLCDIYD